MEITKAKIYNVLFLFDTKKGNVLLLKRAPKKHTKNLDGLLTGIGGKIEFDKGEGDDLKVSVFRELEEETKINRNDITNLRHPIATFQVIESFENITATIYWYTALLNESPKDLSCIEGELAWYPCKDVHQLAIQERMTDSKYVLPWILDHNAIEAQTTKVALLNNLDKKNEGMFIAGEGFYSPFKER
ncbi:MAG: NUDIX domain-containing protein [Alphaproteobacteria bacterium]|nr:NUDIX domain-containing protein [Alphaproteobacteria bacterium]MBN2779757.1 NUDIX domain-containing protein [Alphaproteobacteria bacterium]